MALTDKLSAIANAIRAKTGKTDPMTLDAMPTEIEGISVGGSGAIEPLTVTENGTYTPPEGVDGYSPVEVNVPIPDGYIKPSGTQEITQNGTYDITEKASVDVNVAPPASDIDAFLTNDYDLAIMDVASLVVKVRNGAFAFMTYLKTVNLPNATDLGNASSDNIGVFKKCKYLKTVNLPKVEFVGTYTFSGCENIETIDLPSLKGTIPVQCFSDCNKLKTVNIPGAVTVNGNAFEYCTSLEEVNLPNVTTINNRAFSACGLSRLVFPKVTTCGAAVVENTMKLWLLDFSVLTSVNYNAFQNCRALTALVLRNSAQILIISDSRLLDGSYHFHGTVNATYNPEGLKDGYIYVPSALVDSYKAATNWSTFADQFRALEDYTVDGTITGELDETKI